MQAQGISQRRSPIPTPSRRRKWILPVVLLIALIAAGGYAYWRLQPVSAANTPKTNTQTTITVQRGDLTASISGTGSIISGQTLQLGFLTSGKLASVNVQIGDVVKAGQVLATLDTLPKLQQAVAEDQLTLQLAQQALDDLTADPVAAVAKAQATQASAQATYTQAQNSVHTKYDPTCSVDLTHSYWDQYTKARDAAAVWESALANGNTGFGMDYILKNLRPARIKRDTAYINWEFCQGYTDQQIQESQAAFQLSSAQLQQAQSNYQALKANAGIDPTQVQIAQVEVENARLQLLKAQTDLQAATLTAPMDGTILKLNGSVGQPAPKTAFLTLGNLDHPVIQVNIDETDLSSFQTGCPATITFDSIAGHTFTGKVVQVYPSLASVRSVAMAQGVVSIDPKGHAMPLGLNASVEIQCNLATNVITLPEAAVYSTTKGQTYVNLIGANGQPQQRDVVVGATLSGKVEIRSGLQVGDRVIQ